MLCLQQGTCMTSASELFHNRRSRFGRSSHLELVGGEEQESSSPPLYSHSHRIPHHNIRRHHRHSYHYSNNNHHAATTSAATTRRELNRLEFDGFDSPLPRRSPRPHRPSLPVCVHFVQNYYFFTVIFVLLINILEIVTIDIFTSL